MATERMGRSWGAAVFVVFAIFVALVLTQAGAVVVAATIAALVIDVAYNLLTRATSRHGSTAASATKPSPGDPPTVEEVAFGKSPEDPEAVPKETLIARTRRHISARGQFVIAVELGLIAFLVFERTAPGGGPSSESARYGALGGWVWPLVALVALAVFVVARAALRGRRSNTVAVVSATAAFVVLSVPAAVAEPSIGHTIGSIVAHVVDGLGQPAPTAPSEPAESEPPESAVQPSVAQPAPTEPSEPAESEPSSPPEPVEPPEPSTGAAAR